MTRLVVVALRCPHCREPMPRPIEDVVAAHVQRTPIRCGACGGEASVRLRALVHAYAPPVLALLGAEEGPSEALAGDLEIIPWDAI